MSIIKNITNELKKLVNQAGYEVENLILQPSGRKDLGQYQLNDVIGAEFQIGILWFECNLFYVRACPI